MITKNLYQSLVQFLFMPQALNLAKGDNEEEREKYAKKATKTLSLAIFFSYTTYWGWSVLHD